MALSVTNLKGAMRKGAMNNHHHSDANGTDVEDGTNERSALLRHVQRIGSTDSGTPYYKHSNPVIRYPSQVIHTTWEVLKTNYVNVFLVFVPLGILSGLLNWSPVLQFVLNFIAIIPLASLLAFATEELAVPLGQTLGGLLNATFGNAVELIVCLTAQPPWYVLIFCRSASSLFAMVRFVSSKQACWVRSYQTSSLSLAAAL